MPEALKKEELDRDPTVAKQWDDKTGTEEKFNDMYAIADKLGICMMGTARNNLGPVGRSMAVAKRTGPDFIFLANANSMKFDDIESNKITNLYFQNSSTMDWISVTGETVTSSNDDPRIKEVWSKSASVWFGDLGDGTHTGKPEDPRMKLIEVQPKYISYWKSEVSTLGFMKEIGGAMMTGGIPNTGTLRQMHADEIQQARQMHSSMSSKSEL